VHNGGWWKELHYVEVLAVIDEQRARTTTAYGGFTRMILPAVQRTLAAGGGALNFAVAVDDVPAAIAAMRAAGVAAEQHTVRLKMGPFTIAAFTIGWPPTRRRGPRSSSATTRTCDGSRSCCCL
jgi:hypothetical protein